MARRGRRRKKRTRFSVGAEDAIVLENAALLARDIDGVINRAMRREALEEAVEEGTKALVTVMKRFAPRDTGTGIENIIYERVERRSLTRVAFEAGPSGDGWYILLFEYGFRTHPPRPWMRPASSAARPLVKAVMADVFRRNIFRALARTRKTVRLPRRAA